MSTRRWVLAGAMLAAAGYVAAIQIRPRASAEEQAFIREYPDALLYKGLGLFRQQDYSGAIEAWEHYIRIAPKGADTVSVREVIEEARAAAAGGWPADSPAVP